MRHAGRLLACMLLATVSLAPASAEEAQVVSVCQIHADPDAFIGREVLAEGRLVRSAHGLYSDMAGCPTISLMVVLADGAQPETGGRLMQAASYVGLPEDMRAPPVIMHARVELNDHTLQGTTYVYKRLMLAISKVESAQ